MRDYVLLSMVFGLAVVALRHPWIGVLGFTWLSIMNPHEYTWVASKMPVVAVIACATLIGMAISRDRKSFFITPESATLMLFMLWISITYPFSFSPDASYEMWTRIIKIDFMILVTLVLLHSKRQILLFVWVVTLSLGILGVKGGVFTLLTGGAHRVWGPGGFIGGNNEVALAFIIVVPLMRFLQLQARNKWVRMGWGVAMALTAVAAIGSHSRGALLAAGAMAVYLWLKSPHKLTVGVGIALAAICIIALMPDEWQSRMATIENYQQDSSAMGRINAWWMAWNLAVDRFAGGGFAIYNASTFARYAPDPLDVHAAHSIYFQVLGEQGFFGLALFLAIWWFVWRSAGWLIRRGGASSETLWCKHLGAMCQVSLAGYAVGGAFLSLAYFDLPYDILVMVVLAKRWLMNHEKQTVNTSSSAASASSKSKNVASAVAPAR